MFAVPSGREGEILRARRQAGAHRIVKNVIPMLLVVRSIADAVVRWLGLPDSAQPQLPPGRRRIPTFDVLHGFLQRNLLLGSDDEMEMIGHDHELVQLKSPLAAIRIECVNEQFGCVCIRKKRVPSVRHGCDEKGSYFLGSMGHVRLNETHHQR